MKNNYQFLENKIDLTEDKAHVFLLNLDELNQHDFQQCLTKDESDRANKLKVVEKRKQFIVSRGILRKLLSNFLDINEIVISYGPHKKPYIEHQFNNNSVIFNISHSANYVLIAITLNNEMGIDIEKINPDIDFKSLSKRFFSTKEKNELIDCDFSKQLETFYRVWTRKEAFIKATGKGISFGLDNFSVALEKSIKSKVELAADIKKSKQWFCYDLMEVDNYALSLASDKNDLELIFYP